MEDQEQKNNSRRRSAFSLLRHKALENIAGICNRGDLDERHIRLFAVHHSKTSNCDLLGADRKIVAPLEGLT